MKEKELLDEIPERFLLATDSKLQSIRRLMQVKKVSPEHMSILSNSVLAVDIEDETEGLTSDNKFDENGMMRVYKDDLDRC